MLVRVALLIVLALLIGGAVLLTAWEIPPPTHHVEIVVPDDRFAR